jgi:hypothetical protein
MVLQVTVLVLQVTVLVLQVTVRVLQVRLVVWRVRAVLVACQYHRHELGVVRLQPRQDGRVQVRVGHIQILYVGGVLQSGGDGVTE